MICSSFLKAAAAPHSAPHASPNEASAVNSRANVNSFLPLRVLVLTRSVRHRGLQRFALCMVSVVVQTPVALDIVDVVRAPLLPQWPS